MLKTESNKPYVIVDEYLLGELRHWQNQQVDIVKKTNIFSYNRKDCRHQSAKKYRCSVHEMTGS